jgi:hypothetical protein
VKDKTHELNTILQGRPSIPVEVKLLIENIDKLYDTEWCDTAVDIYDYLHEKIEKSPALARSVKDIRIEWEKYEKRYFSQLAEYFQVSKIRNMRGYLTSINGFPYNAKAGTFFVPIFNDIGKRINVIMHETMHIVFRDNYEEKMRKAGLGDDGVFLVTEAFADLLNTRFKEINPIKEAPKSKAKGGTKSIIDKIDELNESDIKFLDKLEELIKIVKK